MSMAQVTETSEGLSVERQYGGRPGANAQSDVS